MAFATALRSPMAALTLVLLTGCGGSEAEQRGPQTPEVGFVVAKLDDVTLGTDLPGRIAAFAQSEVRPQVSGIIRSRGFAEGSIVRAGQTLYQIDPGLYSASAAEAEAGLNSAIATRDAAVERANRLRPLASMEAVSKQDYSDAAAAARQASAAVAQSRAQLDTARIQLRYTRVPAPITGRIGRSAVTVGALVTANQAEPLALIQRLDPVYVDVQQSSADILSLRRQLASGGVAPARVAVRLKLEDGSDYGLTGQLEFSEQVVDPSTGAVTLRARFPNPSGLLLPGMFVRATIAQATARGAVLVPQGALTRNAEGQANVFIVGAGNKAQRRPVVADRTLGDKWIVTSGLNPGDRIITEGLGKVRDGQAVKPVPAGSPPAASPAATKAGDAAAPAPKS